MIRLIIKVLSLVFVVVQALPEAKISLDTLQQLVHEVNAKQTTWTAGINFHSSQGLLDLKYTVGVILEDPDTKLGVHGNASSANCENHGHLRLPAHFDARKRWKKTCSATLDHVYDQGNCGSCWAVSTVSAFTDRLCIKSKGKNATTSLRSVQQLLSCCHECGHGCDGGQPLLAWDYLVSEGVATGGEYNSTEGCQPYLLKPCAHHVNDTDLVSCSAMKTEGTPACELHCYNKNYSISFKKDEVKASTAYKVDPCEAQNEIYKKGPIVAAFAVYEDFLNYKSGVYKHVAGKMVGYHAVRVIGWGVERGTPYWLVINSWNKSWGDDGLFKILRGHNEVKFENYFTAGSI